SSSLLSPSSLTARSCHSFACFGCASALLRREEADAPLDEEPLKKFWRTSLMPVEPEPTPKKTNPAAKTKARNTNIHFAGTRSREKKSWSSQRSCLTPFGFALPLAGAWATRACVCVRRLRCCVPLATRCLLACSGTRRPRSSRAHGPGNRRRRPRPSDPRPDRTGFLKETG